MTYQKWKEEFEELILLSSEKGKKNEFQAWATQFVEDKNPFVLKIPGEGWVEISRYRIACTALRLGMELKEKGQYQFPKGFFSTEVLPQVVSQFAD